MFVNFCSSIGFALCAILLTISYFYLKYVYSYWQRRGVPHFKPTIPFGNFTKSFMQKLSMSELIDELYCSTTEPYIGIYAAHRPMLMIRSPSLIQDILIKDFQYFTDRGIYYDEQNDPLSANIVALDGDKWKHLRQKLTPAFTSGKIRAIFPTLLDCRRPLQNYISQMARTNRIIEAREMAACYTLNVIASVAFGIDIDCFTDPMTPFRVYGRRFFGLSLKNGFRFLCFALSPNLLKWSGLRLMDRDVEEFFMNLTKQTLELREANNIVRKDLFQLLLQLQNSGEIQVDDEWQMKTANNCNKTLSFNELAAQVVIFLVGGFESSSATMMYCLFEIARNPNIQRKVHEELDRVLAQHNGQLTYDSINELQYLECCIDETLRKYPFAPFLNRLSTKDYKIPGTDITVEKGTAIVIPTFSLHRDEKYYPDPLKFDPMHFDSENKNGKTMIDMPYYAFGDGPRGCIGTQLAKVSLRVGLTSILQQHWVDIDDRHIGKEIKYSAQSFPLVPADGIYLKFKYRQ